MISVDTSVVVRHLVGTPPELARRATQLLDGDDLLGLPALVLLETAFVLRTEYGVARGDVLEALLSLVTREDIELIGLPKAAALEGLTRARRLPGAPLADALIAASARAAGALPLYTFDRGFAAHGVPVVEP